MMKMNGIASFFSFLIVGLVVINCSSVNTTGRGTETAKPANEIPAMATIIGKSLDQLKQLLRPITVREISSNQYLALDYPLKGQTCFFHFEDGKVLQINALFAGDRFESVARIVVKEHGDPSYKDEGDWRWDKPGLLVFVNREAIGGEILTNLGMKAVETSKNYIEMAWDALTAMDFEKAVYWWTKAAEQGHADAQYYLGACYGRGEGVAKDSEKAVYWYTKAAEQGHTEAQYYLGNRYYTGDGIAKDFGKAAYWWTKAAEQGDVRAQYYLGFCYYNGLGVAKDSGKAVYWLTKAVEQGHADAQFQLGEFYYNGEGVAKDSGKAMYWWTEAAEQGHVDAQYNLGTCYDLGLGVAKDFEKAMYWYTKAAEQGYARAQKALADLQQ
jgi:TPR repeat protein